MYPKNPHADTTPSGAIYTADIKLQKMAASPMAECVAPARPNAMRVSAAISACNSLEARAWRAWPGASDSAKCYLPIANAPAHCLLPGRSRKVRNEGSIQHWQTDGFLVGKHSLLVGAPPATPRSVRSESLRTVCLDKSSLLRIRLDLFIIPPWNVMRHFWTLLVSYRPIQVFCLH